MKPKVVASVMMKRNFFII